MTKGFRSEIDKFPISQDEWAYMMLHMHKNKDDYPEFKPPFDIFEFSPQKTIQSPRNLDEAKSQLQEMR